LLVAFWFLSFGLLPIWVMWAWLAWEGRNASDSYWTAAPWLIVAVIPLCSVSLTVAALAWLVYVRVSGSRWRKFMYAGPCYLLLLAGAAYTAKTRWETHKAERAALAEQAIAEKAAAERAVEQSEFVAASVRGPFRVSTIRMTTDSQSIPKQFVASVHSPDDGPTSLLAIVDVTRAADVAEFHVTCLISPDDYRRLDSQLEACQSDAALRHRETRP
jgi:hypothetical protein